MSRERALLRRLVELRDKKWLSPPITLDRGGRPLRPSRRWKDDEVSLEHAISAIGLIAAEAAALLAAPEGEESVDWLALAKQYRATCWPLMEKDPPEYAEAQALEAVFGPILQRYRLREIARSMADVPTPLSRAEAEAMVERVFANIPTTKWGEVKVGNSRPQLTNLKHVFRAALLRALTGGEG